MKREYSKDPYLVATEILDYHSDTIQELITKQNWSELNDFDKIQSIYNFVRDEIAFGYNTDDAISASKVLNDGFGQCNTKANLFMALLSGVGIRNRMHGFTIDKALQKGAISGIWYHLSPKNILHCWVEVQFEGEWYNLEGLILDAKYLMALQNKFSECKTTFCGYGAYTDNFENPEVNWNKNDTYIQKEGINQDFGLFNTPDEFYTKHKQELGVLKKFMFLKFVRQIMNRNVRRIRNNY